MCGRYTLAGPDPALIRARFPVGEAVEIRRRFNVAPGDDVLAVTTDREGAPRGELLRWGLVPPWSAGPAATAAKMINARRETIMERPAYRGAFQRFRCLIVADGFYEWRRSAAGPSQPFHITRQDGEPFAFAGLWSVWHGPGEETIRSCTIITTQANPTVAPLHDRMPVILPADGERIWLDAEARPPALLELLAPLEDTETALRAVSRAVNDARHDDADCLADAEPDLIPPTLF